MFCRERAAQVRARENEIAARGARLLFVGPGTAAMAKDFADHHAGGHVVLADPEKITFRAAAMRRGVLSVLHWRSFTNMLRALKRGFRQSKIQGDPWQQGGVVVLDAAGGLLHAEADRTGGDPLDLDAVIAALPPPAAA